MEKSTQKSTFLKVMAIITLVFGIINVAMDAIGVAAIITINGFLDGIGAIPMSGFIVASVAAVIMVVAGIYGIGASKNPEKTKICIILGIIIVAVAVFALLLNVVQTGPIHEYAAQIDSANGNPTLSSVLGSVFGIVWPALYVLAAFLFKKKAAA